MYAGRNYIREQAMTQIERSYIKQKQIRDLATGFNYIVGCGPQHAGKNLNTIDIVDLLVEVPECKQDAFFYAALNCMKQEGSLKNPTYQEINIRAGQLWKDRGCPVGSPNVDWYQAEQELERKLNGVPMRLPEDRIISLSRDITEAWGLTNMRAAFKQMGNMGFVSDPKIQKEAEAFALVR